PSAGAWTAPCAAAPPIRRATDGAVRRRTPHPSGRGPAVAAAHVAPPQVRVRGTRCSTSAPSATAPDSPPERCSSSRAGAARRACLVLAARAAAVVLARAGALPLLDAGRANR